MMNQEQESDREKWVYDLSLDHKGRVPLRASTGAWRASFFVIAAGFCESLCYFGVAANLIVYMTNELNQDIATAVRNVNYWTGMSTIMALVGGFVADSYFGGFATVAAASVVYLMGLLLLTLSRVIPRLKPCDSEPCHEPRKIHQTLFFLAIYTLSIGTGWYKPSVESFGANQFDDDHLKERLKKMSFFNWFVFALCFGFLVGVTGIVYIQDLVGWAALDIVLTSVMAFALVMFCLGRPFYRFRKPTGSPLTPMLQVLVAAILKRSVAYPSGPQDLYEVPKPDEKQGKRLLFHTNKLRFLDKAAIIEETQIPTIKHNPWRLATVTSVEELKLMIYMIPIWLTMLPFGICLAQSNTFFIKQCMILDRKIGSRFTIPPPTMFGFSSVGIIFCVTIYDRVLVPFLRRVTGNERGINILPRMGIGLIFSAIAMVVAALVEKKRLDTVEKNSGSESMSVFWIAPQYLIMGIAESFTMVGLQEYFYEQAPDSMRSLGIALYLSVIGTGSFASSLLVTLVERVTKRGKSWFDNDLNHSRLDYFYYLLAGIAALDVCVFVFVAMNASYKNVRKTTVAAVEEDCDDEGYGMRV